MGFRIVVTDRERIAHLSLVDGATGGWIELKAVCGIGAGRVLALVRLTRVHLVVSVIPVRR